MSDNYCNCEVCGDEFSQLSSHRGPDLCWDCNKKSDVERWILKENRRRLYEETERSARKKRYVEMRRSREEYNELHAEFGEEVVKVISEYEYNLNVRSGREGTDYGDEGDNNEKDSTKR